MKHLFKTTIFIFIGLFVVSCTKDNELLPKQDPFVKNVNNKLFTEVEIGKDFTISNTADDVHINFEYAGKSKVTKIIFDVEPLNVPKVNKGEVKWELKNHVVPVKHYAGKINPHVHYHFHLEDANDKEITPAEGTYNFRITVEHEDKSKSYITKKITVVKGEKSNKERFTGLEIGKDFTVLQSKHDVHVEFDYKGGKSKITKITFNVTPHEVDKVNKGEVKWTLKDYVVPEKHYKGKLNAHIHYHLHLEDKNGKEIIPAVGEYDFKITVEHEDKTKSYITKEIKVLQGTKFDQNIHPERFTDLEIGNSKFVMIQANKDMHVNFKLKGGKSKVTKITLDVEPYDVHHPKAGELEWKLKGYVIPQKKYEGQLEPNIHYHLHYNKKGETKKLAVGVYKFRIVVEHEDGTKSAITKKFTVVKKFNGIEVGENDSRKVKLGAKDLHFEYQYLAEAGTIEKITHKIWFIEWRKNQVRPDGKKVTKYNFIEQALPATKHQTKDPKVHEHIDLLKDFPKGTYYLEINVREKGEKESVRLFIPFEIG